MKKITLIALNWRQAVAVEQDQRRLHRQPALALAFEPIFVPGSDGFFH